MSHSNVALAHRWFEEVWNQRRLSTALELLTEKSVCRADLGDLVGPQDFITRRYEPFVSAFPDLRVEIEGTVSEGEQVVVRWIASATHTGEGLGFPPTGRKVRFPGMTWIRFENGKMMEGQDGWNIDGLLASLK